MKRLPLALAIAAAFPCAVFSQSSAQTEPTLRSVIVRAEKPDALQSPNLATGAAGTSLTTPFSVSRVSSQQVRDQGGTTLQDALRNVPGAQADSGFLGSHTQFFTLRGAIADSGTGSNRVLRDGVRLSNYPFVNAFIESVDVLSGPGAAVGVRSEPGGTVNLSTVRPQMSNFGSVLLGVGSAHKRELSVDVNRVLSQDNELAVRVTATKSDASQWRHVPDKLNGLKLGLAKSDGERYRLHVGYEATNQTYRPDYGLPSLNGRVVAVPSDRQLSEPFGDSTTDNRIFDLNGDIALSANTKLSFAYTNLNADSTVIRNVIFGNPLASPPNALGTWTRSNSWEPNTTRRINSFNTALTTRQNWGGIKHQLYVGLDAYKEKLHQPTLSGAAWASPAINVFNPVFGLTTAPAPGAVLNTSLTTQDLDATGLSVQDQMDFGAWTVVAGMRYDRQKFLFGVLGTKPVDESRWSPKLAVLNRLTDSDTVYANVSTGLAPNQVPSATNQSLPSRRAGQVELGWKSLWQGGALISNLAVYRLNQSNMISSDLSTANTFDFTVEGTARSQGVEASLKGAVSKKVDVAFTYAYTDAKYLKNAVNASKQVANVAPHALNLWGQYRWNQSWTSSLGLYVQSKRFADTGNTTVLPGYGRVDMTHTWTQAIGQGQALEMQLAVRNLFDKAYFVSGHLHTPRWVMPGQGRNVSLTGTYRF